MEEIEGFLQKTVDVEAVILKPRFDSNMVKMKGEKLKASFFSKLGFLKPKDEDITIVALNKYYEPFVIVGGKYSINYCKRQSYAIEVEDETRELLINGKKFVSEPLAQGKRNRFVKFVGEEYPSYQIETYLVFDRTLQEVSPEKLFLAPFDHELERQQDSVFDLKKANIHMDEAIERLRAKIVKRPSDVTEVIKEAFEITSRIAVFKPTYELVFHNARDGKKVTALIDGITGEIDLEKSHFSKKRVDESSDSSNQNFVINKIPLSPGLHEQFRNQKSIISSSATIEESSQKSETKEELDSLIGESESESCFPPNAKNATFLAINFLRSLGYQQELRPKKLSRIGEEYMVEIGFEKGMARVQVDAKANEVRDYRIDGEGKHFQTKSIRSILIVLLAVFAALSLLKLINFF
jgi:hypothetical protein